MAIMNFLSDIRNAALANAVIVIFHIYIAFAVEGPSFLVIVLPIGALVAGAYFVKGKIGARAPMGSTMTRKLGPS
ncbi:MAG: hypothetical protein EGP03_06790, partial [SAR202 cluster bacterium]